MKYTRMFIKIETSGSHDIMHKQFGEFLYSIIILLLKNICFISFIAERVPHCKRMMLTQLRQDIKQKYQSSSDIKKLKFLNSLLTVLVSRTVPVYSFKSHNEALLTALPLNHNGFTSHSNL